MCTGLFLFSITGFYKGIIIIDLDQKDCHLAKESALCYWAIIRKTCCILKSASHKDHAVRQHAMVYLFEILFSL